MLKLIKDPLFDLASLLLPLLLFFCNGNEKGFHDYKVNTLKGIYLKDHKTITLYWSRLVFHIRINSLALLNHSLLFYLLVPFILFSFLIFFKTTTKWTMLFISLLIILLVTWHRYHLYYSFGIPPNPNPNQLIYIKETLIDLRIRYQVIPRLDSIMYGVLGAFLAYYTPKIWNNKLNVFL